MFMTLNLTTTKKKNDPEPNVLSSVNLIPILVRLYLLMAEIRVQSLNPILYLLKLIKTNVFRN